MNIDMKSDTGLEDTNNDTVPIRAVYFAPAKLVNDFSAVPILILFKLCIYINDNVLAS